MRYEVFFDDCDSVMEFATEDEAKHCACLNAGGVHDMETGRVIVDYRKGEE